jgi:hypothetical protein
MAGKSDRLFAQPVGAASPSRLLRTGKMKDYLMNEGLV